MAIGRPCYRSFVRITSILLFGLVVFGRAHAEEAASGPMMTMPTSYLSDARECQASMEYWDAGGGMCSPLPMPAMSMQTTMVHFNAFGVWVNDEGPRGQHGIASPNMAMITSGESVGSNQYVAVDLMATTELWTFPPSGYPELLQIGEEDRHGHPFIDAQHPHSSPIMGLTFSDTFTLAGSHNHLRLSFAPRGESTDGPTAFMHRITGMVNPDVPLGHHIGQDVGHITSTVIAASLGLGGTTVEVSTFSGREPEPTKVDLPIERPDSYSGRVIRQFSPEWIVMASAAYVHDPEHDPSLEFLTRYSASVYWTKPLDQGWTFYNTLIYGAIHNYDEVGLLQSYGEEFLLRTKHANVFGRLEVLERTPAELEVSYSTTPYWVSALTVGYTRIVGRWDGNEFGVGGSMTREFIPFQFRSGTAGYGADPNSFRVFVQVGGMHMWGMGEG